MRASGHIYTSSYRSSTVVPLATVVLRESLPASGKHEYSPSLRPTRKREQVGITRTEFHKPLHVVLRIIQGSRPAAHLNIAGAWSRSTSEIVMDKGGTDSLVSFFGSTCSFVVSGISVVWQLNETLFGPRQMNKCARETKVTQALHKIVRLHQQCYGRY